MRGSTKKVVLARGSGLHARQGAADEKDGALLGELVLLLSNLEFLRAQLAALPEHGRSSEAMHLMSLMMDEAVAVAERHQASEWAGDAAALVLAEVGTFYTAAQAVRKAAGASGVRSLWGLLRSGEDSTAAREMYSQTCNQFLEVLTAVLRLFDAEFKLPGPAKEWDQARSVFLDELKKVKPLQGI